MRVTATGPSGYQQTYGDDHVHRHMLPIERLLRSGALAVTVHRVEGDYRYERYEEGS